MFFVCFFDFGVIFFFFNLGEFLGHWEVSCSLLFSWNLGAGIRRIVVSNIDATNERWANPWGETLCYGKQWMLFTNTYLFTNRMIHINSSAYLTMADSRWQIAYSRLLMAMSWLIAVITVEGVNRVAKERRFPLEPVVRNLVEMALQGSWGFNVWGWYL